MDVRNCKGCGKLFNYIGGTPLCPNCIKALDEKFVQVKQYIYDNKGANIQQVADDNEVSIQQLRQWVREEKLEFSDASLVGLACDNCGAMIRSGRFCKNCKDKLANKLGNAFQKAPEPEVKKTNSSARMRFLDN